MNTDTYDNVICLASYRAVTGQQPQPANLVQPFPAIIIRFEKVWAEKNRR